MEIKKAFRFRLYPTREQLATLAAWEGQLRLLWNLAHEQRLLWYNRTRYDRQRAGAEAPTYFSQAKEMTALVADDAHLRVVPACVRQEVLRDLEKAWQRFLKRLSGLPRFKRRGAAMRMYAPDASGWSLEGDEEARLRMLRFRRLGEIAIRQNRPLEGTPSSCTLARDVDEWYANLLCTLDLPDPVPRSGPVVGLNRGVICLVADSEGRIIENPRFYERSLDLLQRRQRQAARKEPGSKNAQKAQRKVARIHRRIRRQREHVLHEISKDYVDRYGVIALDALDTRRMMSSLAESDLPQASLRAIRRGIGDTGWGKLAEMLRYKAETRGTRVLTEPSVDITTTCSRCGVVDPRSAKGRRFACVECGLELHADVNAARNVEARALAELQKPAPSHPRLRKKIGIPGRTKKAESASSSKPAAEPVYWFSVNRTAVG